MYVSDTVCLYTKLCEMIQEDFIICHHNHLLIIIVVTINETGCSAVWFRNRAEMYGSLQVFILTLSFSLNLVTSRTINKRDRSIVIYTHTASPAQARGGSHEIGSYTCLTCSAYLDFFIPK